MKPATTSKNGGKKLSFIPYQRFIILFNIDNNSQPFYSNRFCRKSIALSEAERMSMLAGINAEVYDTKKKRFIEHESNTLEIKIDSIFSQNEEG